MRNVVVAVWAGAALLLTACASAPPPKPVPSLVPIPLDASYDWHVLLTAPFGSVLKDVPFSLHEVLQFRDAAPGGPVGEEAECYGIGSKPPRFIDRAPDEYLLCFKYDRLSRIEATVRLPQAEAAKIFADACGLWIKNAAAVTDACAGSQGIVGFSGRLEGTPDDAELLLTVKLDASDR
jgi:hypothetical protein